MILPFKFLWNLFWFRALTIIYVCMSGLDCLLVIGFAKKKSGPVIWEGTWAGSKVVHRFIDAINGRLQEGAR